MRIDPGKLAQVFINLIANAVLHSDLPQVEITIASSRPEPGSYLVEIADNGPGIPEALRQRIFEPFFRGSRAGSAGLGLPISARILESFGGGIEAVRARAAAPASACGCRPARRREGSAHHRRAAGERHVADPGHRLGQRRVLRRPRSR